MPQNSCWHNERPLRSPVECRNRSHRGRFATPTIGRPRFSSLTDIRPRLHLFWTWSWRFSLYANTTGLKARPPSVLSVGRGGRLAISAGRVPVRWTKKLRQQGKWIWFWGEINMVILLWQTVFNNLQNAISSIAYLTFCRLPVSRLIFWFDTSIIVVSYIFYTKFYNSTIA